MFHHASHFFAASSALIVLCTAGCIPVVRTTVPEITGRVTNTAGQPLSGASVHFTCDYPPRTPAFDLTTNEQGRFHRSAQSHLEFIPLFATICEWPAPMFAIASMDGRESAPTPLYHYGATTRRADTDNSPPGDLGDLIIPNPPADIPSTQSPK